MEVNRPETVWLAATDIVRNIRKSSEGIWKR